MIQVVTGSKRLSRRLKSAAVALSGTLLGACSSAPADRNGSAPAGTAMPALRREDVLWIERIELGLDSAAIADYRRLGRERFLAAQLTAREEALPGPIAAQIEALAIAHAEPQ